jgi:hypothetical protein
LIYSLLFSSLINSPMFRYTLLFFRINMVNLSIVAVISLVVTSRRSWKIGGD